MAITIEATETLQRGARTEFTDAYKVRYKGVRDAIGELMDMAIPSDTEIELFSYFLTPPYAKVWPKGTPIPEAGMSSRSFTVTNRDWAVRLPWFENDKRYDQTRSMMSHARSAGGSLGGLAERVFFQFMRGNVDSDLLPAIPNAADGVALYSTTDGTGGNRYGVVNGNLLTGSGVGSGVAIKNDFYAACSQALLMQDTQGQPLWDADLVAEGIVIFYNPANELVFAEGFNQAIQQGTQAGVSNIIVDTGRKVQLRANQRITDNKWYIWFKKAPKKALLQTISAPVRDNLADMTNSDLARTFKIEYLQWDMSGGYGCAEAYQTIEISN